MPNGSFSYESVAYIQFLCLELQNVIEKSPTNNQFPVKQSQIPLMLQQLYNTLETFIQELIIESLTEYNRLLNYITNGIDIISVQPVTAAVGIPPEQPQVFVNFFTALQTTTGAFFTSPAPITNQNLRNVLNPLYIFLRDFQVQGYTQYAKFLTVQILQSFNEQPLCMEKISQLLQQLCAEMANLIERLIMDETLYEQLATLLAQIAANSTVCSGGRDSGPTGHTGPTGAKFPATFAYRGSNITKWRIYSS
ncbi:collagen-like repeat preface domain-containing protein [Bacillus tropicus]|uniref:collagen-like repeat preface domain-containing protein n=1 Tax=Bacillus tropicus TaxID=2026188 RepID=UPI003D25DEB9